MEEKFKYIIVWKDGTWKSVEEKWDYEGGEDFLVAIPIIDFQEDGKKLREQEKEQTTLP